MNIRQILNSRKSKILIALITLVIPVLIMLLAFIPKLEVFGAFNYQILPLLNALINGTTFLILLAAYFAIRSKRIRLHQTLMVLALILSSIFLLSYIVYHAAVEETHYGGQGGLRILYFFILISHILLSATVIPLALITFGRALSQNYVRHKSIARYTLPIWLYVTLTGVIVYLLISPYYPS